MIGRGDVLRSIRLSLTIRRFVEVTQQSSCRATGPSQSHCGRCRTPSVRRCVDISGMERHAVADVQVHSTPELSSILGVEITGREQLRVWPLSSVELLTDADGSRMVYKSQRLLTVEPAFYRAAGAVRSFPRAESSPKTRAHRR
jgi:hypothetical protein